MVEIDDRCHVFTSILAPLIAGLFSSFTPNCTLPSEPTNYVSGPNVRSTLGILWDCLSVILLCTWSVLHLNVPARRPPISSTIQKIWWAILDSRKKVKWMMLAILMPEILVVKALNDFLAVRWSHYPERSKIANDGETVWDSAHILCCEHGGICTRLH